MPGGAFTTSFGITSNDTPDTAHAVSLPTWKRVWRSRTWSTCGRAMTSRNGVRIVCMCDDCQTFAHFLGRADEMPEAQ